jgi:hypothetical protein
MMWDDSTLTIGDSPQSQNGTVARWMNSTPKSVPGLTTPHTTPITWPDVLPPLSTLRRTEIMTPNTPLVQRQLPIRDKIRQRTLEQRLIQQQQQYTGDLRLENP